MKNDECTIYIITKNGSKQSFRKDKNGWKQTSSRGIVRSCTAEQVLSHILPPLAFGHVTIKVELDHKKEKQKKNDTDRGKQVYFTGKNEFKSLCWSTLICSL